MINNPRPSPLYDFEAKLTSEQVDETNLIDISLPVWRIFNSHNYAYR